MDNVVKFPTASCSSCGAEDRDLLKIELLNFDTQESAGAKYLCKKCRPLDEDGLRLLLDDRDSTIAHLRAELAQWVRQSEDNSGGWQRCQLALERARKALEEIVAANKDFRAGMPKDWEGDPLQDAVDAASSLLAQQGKV
jgi:hypothetical protein